MLLWKGRGPPARVHCWQILPLLLRGVLSLGLWKKDRWLGVHCEMLINLSGKEIPTVCGTHVLLWPR